MASRAVPTSERDVAPGVDGETIILILNVGIGYCEACRGTDVKGVSVVPAAGVASRVVNSDGVEGQIGATRDREDLYRTVLNGDSFDGRASGHLR